MPSSEFTNAFAQADLPAPEYMELPQSFKRELSNEFNDPIIELTSTRIFMEALLQPNIGPQSCLKVSLSVVSGKVHSFCCSFFAV
jgi:hypothetical protein